MKLVIINDRDNRSFRELRELQVLPHDEEAGFTPGSVAPSGLVLRFLRRGLAFLHRVTAT